MSRYIITITPDLPNGSAGAQTTVTVEVSSGGARVQELLVRSADDRGLLSAELPSIDYGLLVRALNGGADSTGAESDTTSTVAATPSRRRGRAAGTAAAAAAASKKTAPQARTRGNARSAVKRTTRRASAETAGGERAYRRMPEPDEVLAAYQQSGSITALAEHFGVPRHTAQGWAGRLRRIGYEIGRS